MFLAIHIHNIKDTITNMNVFFFFSDFFFF